ncbi:hypothetical protein IE53DRAFT_368325 [Violaceomyces palustris]|uniref:Uncharacterized protein n=1 Tax=Violaceomyces palustris TaxID=1673888 RepID=A0ACD0NZ87_9BASI|nr:hypothetical protein IE53DRAFT_368325 [Violaceomyces palustris]
MIDTYPSPGSLLCERSSASIPSTHGLDDKLLSRLVPNPGSPRESALLKRLRAIRRQSSQAYTPRHGRFISNEPDLALSGITTGGLTELFWKGPVLTWSRGSALLRSFTFQENVKQAFWTWLDVASSDSPVPPPCGPRAAPKQTTGSRNHDRLQLEPRSLLLPGDNPFSQAQRQMKGSNGPGSSYTARPENHRRDLERALCVFLEKELYILFPHHGDEHTLQISFKLARAFPMPVGLLVQRQEEPEDLKIASGSKSLPPMDVADGRTPRTPGVTTSSFSYRTTQAAQRPASPGLQALLEEEEGEEDEEDEPLPMAFHLRRPLDDFGGFSRVARISTAVDEKEVSPLARSQTLLHGSPSPFSEVGESIVYVSDCTGSNPLPILVSASCSRRSVRIFSYAQKPCEIPTTVVGASAPKPEGVLSNESIIHEAVEDDEGLPRLARDSQASDLHADPRLKSRAQTQTQTQTQTHTHSQSQILPPHSQNQSQSLGQTQSQNQTAAVGSSSLYNSSTVGNSSSIAIGKGRPSTRKSARLELERRSSSFGPNFGRDASGRSRRLSAIHGGGDLRVVSRVDDPASSQSSQFRDHPDDLAQMVEGLARQSQQQHQDPRLEEAGNVSARVAGAATSSRNRRSSHVLRTPYVAPPRTNPRQPGTANRPRPSISMSRPEMSVDGAELDHAGAGLNGNGVGQRTDGEGEASQKKLRKDPGTNEDAGELSDIESFARSFASVALLEEIQVEAIENQQQAQDVSVFFLPGDDREDPLLYISVPAAGIALCRQISRRTFEFKPGKFRSELATQIPAPHRADSEFKATCCIQVMATSLERPDILVVKRDDSFALHIGPVGPCSAVLELGTREKVLGLETKAAVGLGMSASHLSKDMSMENVALFVDEVALRLGNSRGSKLTVEEKRSGREFELCLDLKPRCRLTAHVLKALELVLSAKAGSQLRSEWIKNRFGIASAPRPVRDDASRLDMEGDWKVLKALLCGEPQAQWVASSSEPWEALLCSASHLAGDMDPLMSRFALKSNLPRSKPRTKGAASNSDKLLRDEDMIKVIQILHLLTQDARLDKSSCRDRILPLASLLVKLSLQLGQSGIADYWMRLCPDAALENLTLVPETRTQAPAAAGTILVASDLHQILRANLRGKRKACTLKEFLSTSDPTPTETELRSLCKLTGQVLDVYGAMSESASDQRTGSLPQRDRNARRAVEKMVEVGLGTSEIGRLPMGVCLPLIEAIRSCQLSPPLDWPASAYLLIERVDLSRQVEPSLNEHSTDLSHRTDPKLMKTAPKGEPLDPLCAQLFSKDHRLDDVVKMLQTRRINTVRILDYEDEPGPAVKEEQNRILYASAERVKATTVGRGMLLMASKPFSVTRKWQTPRICLSAKVVPKGPVIWNETKIDAPDMEWPEFHNGVASALEISVSGDTGIDSDWIFSHNTEESGPRHAGFLLGLGLGGHLGSLRRVHAFKYLTPRQNLITVGLLLGLATSCVGTADPAARQILTIQVAAFLPEGSAPLNMSTLTQTAGLMGMGILFLGSNHRWTAEKMLQEISARQLYARDIQTPHREAYSLSAGLALGLVMLGRGRKEGGMDSVPDRRIVEELESLTNGPYPGYLEGLDEEDDDLFDVNMTSTPATIALGLIFLRSNRSDIVSSVLALPGSEEELDSIRPDALLVKVLARQLILFDSIRPTQEWIESTLPDFVRRQRRQRRKLGEAVDLAWINMVAGACFAMALKFAGSQDREAKECLLLQLRSFQKEAKAKALTYFLKIRQSALRASLNLLYISVSMVLSGSGDLELLKVLRLAHGQADASHNYGSHMAIHMSLGLLFLGGGRFSLGTSDSAIAFMIISFFPRFPINNSDNRSHLQALRHLWYLAVEPRLLIAKDVDTREVCYLPVEVSLYAKTMSEGAKVGVKEEKAKGQREGEKLELFSPALLPDFERIRSIRTKSPRYWPTSLEVSESIQHSRALVCTRVINVKRRNGYLSYSIDPKGNRSVLSRCRGDGDEEGGDEVADLDLDFGSSKVLGPERGEALKGLVCKVSGGADETGARGDDGKDEEGEEEGVFVDWFCTPSVGYRQEEERSEILRSLCSIGLMECLGSDKPKALLGTYIELFNRSLDLEAEFKGGPGRRWDSGLFWKEVEHLERFYREDFDRLFNGPSTSDDARGARKRPRETLIQREILTKVRNELGNLSRVGFVSDPGVRRSFQVYLEQAAREDLGRLLEVEGCGTSSGSGQGGGVGNEHEREEREGEGGRERKEKARKLFLVLNLCNPPDPAGLCFIRNRISGIKEMVTKNLAAAEEDSQDGPGSSVRDVVTLILGMEMGEWIDANDGGKGKESSGNGLYGWRETLLEEILSCAGL